MAIEFVDLLDPTTLTESLAIIIMGFVFIIAYLGYKFRAPEVFFFLMLDIIILILTFLTNLSFIWFWIMIAVSFIVITISSIIFYVFD